MNYLELLDKDFPQYEKRLEYSESKLGTMGWLHNPKTGKYVYVILADKELYAKRNFLFDESMEFIFRKVNSFEDKRGFESYNDFPKSYKKMKNKINNYLTRQ